MKDLSLLVHTCDHYEKFWAGMFYIIPEDKRNLKVLPQEKRSIKVELILKYIKNMK